MLSKATPFKESILPKILIILKQLDKQESSPNKLYKAIEKNFDNIGEFSEALDCLFLLNKIDINVETEELYHVKRN